jgi:hypothetical protein
MSERIPPPTDYDKVEWRTNPAGNPILTPSGSKRADGFPNKGVPPSQEENWRYKLYGDVYLWLDQLVAREWADVREGLQNTAAIGDLFKVYGTASGPVTRGTSIFNVTGTAATGGSCVDICTDGEQFYYYSGSPNFVSIIAGNPLDGAELWEYPITTGAARALHCDGLYIYYVNNNAGVPGLQVHNRTTGAFVRTGGIEYNMTQIRANGQIVAGINPAGNPNRVVRYTGLATTVTEATVTSGNTSNLAVAVDADQIYVGGSRGAGADIYAYTNALGSVWNTTLPTVAPPTINAIAADGNVVYVATNSQTYTGFGLINLWALDRLTGSILWFANAGNSNKSLWYLAVDHRYLYCADTSGNLYVLWLRQMSNPGFAAWIYQDTITTWTSLACDGVSVFSGGATNVRRSLFITETQNFQRANPANANRYPFHTLAVPRGEGF